MSSGLPPVPGLIPIAALLRPSGPRRECAPRARCGPMGEQRSRRPGPQPRDLIDSARSRGLSAAPQPPQTRRARSDRHRKSDRRRDHRKPAISAITRTSRAASKQSPKPPTPPPSPERPSPRVNPIFVWVRQEDTRIVDVKCEDYDKRNRILLTKTAQGWRAIPRTETLVPSLSTMKGQVEHQIHHHHRNRKSRKNKVRRKSAAVQVDSDVPDGDEEQPASPTWTSPVNVESHLPSHKIHIPNKCPSPLTDMSTIVDGAADESARPQTPQREQCSAPKPCDVTPLDNLLAVAEFEFKHLQSGEWSEKSQDAVTPKPLYPEIDEDQKEFLTNMEQLNNFIDSCASKPTGDDVPHSEAKSEDCDYTEDEDNNLAMDDILSRLEQSLQSPECPDLPTSPTYDKVDDEVKSTSEGFPCDINENNCKIAPDQELEDLFDAKDHTGSVTEETPTLDNIVESSTPIEEEPTDLSIKPIMFEDNECNNDPELPTDLTLPRTQPPASPNRSETPRPCSQNSEAIQSPQPSGIPAVPPSPDLVSTSANCKNKSGFLESLLTTSSQKIALNSEVTIIKQKEPLDLGKCRKSASPTVTCSEEVKNTIDAEPPIKKFKADNTTLKNLLDLEVTKSSEKRTPSETPRLLELLKTDSGPDPLTQLRQILYDTNLNVPDPMLVPKERLSQIISHPGREIPKLLKQRPELRLPEALAFPHLLQDPDILVITIQQLETIILKQNQSLTLKDLKNNDIKTHDKSAKKMEKTAEVHHARKKCNEDSMAKMMHPPESQTKSGFNELASDIDAATTAAFNQMVWLPYLNQLENMSFGGNPDMMKMLSNSMPMYSGQVPDLNHLVNANRYPPPVNFPMQPYNPLEMSMWQEAMMQANMLRPKVPNFEGLNSKHSFREYLDKLNFAAKMPMGMANPKMPMMNKGTPVGGFMPSGANASYQNFLGVPNGYQSNSSSKHLQVPHYNPMFGQKGMVNPHGKTGHPYLPKQKFDAKPNFAPFYHHQRTEEIKAKADQLKAKVSCKSFASVAYQQRPLNEAKEKPSSGGDPSVKHQTTQPIDLSGSTAPPNRLKVKQHLIDPVNAPKLLKHDDIPEVGSTTASVEEMQDAHKHLWHPLFGNQKGYHNAWNWTTVTATGE